MVVEGDFGGDAVDGLSAGLARDLREARVEAGVSQVRLGELAGLSQGRISAVERGRVRLVSPVLVRLAAALGKRVVVMIE